MLKALSVNEFLDTQGVIIDVRSEGEFEEACVPTSRCLSLFNNAERAEVGTLYKRKGPDAARSRGLEIVEPKLRFFFQQLRNVLSAVDSRFFVQEPDAPIFERIFERLSEHLIVDIFEDDAAVRMRLPPDVPELVSQGPEARSVPLLFYCWRGGARSKSMALLAHSFGFHAAYLEGGHKAFRNHVLDFLNSPYPFKLCTLYGLTGSAKTRILREWLEEGKPVIDLEALAFHRGSAFGQVGIDEYGRQKDFENRLFWEMRRWARTGASVVIVEGESRRIGRCQLPEAFMKAMLDGLHVKVDKTLQERVEHTLLEYVRPVDEERWQREARGALDAIQKRLGGEKHRELAGLLETRRYEEFIGELLSGYYDKMYALSRAPEDFYHGKIKGPEDWARIERLFG